MDITINTDILLKNNLTISEYLYLQFLYKKEKAKTKLEKEEIEELEKVIYKYIDKIDKISLQDKKFIRILNTETILRTNTYNLFDSEDLFLTFLNTFPIKTPSGRYLSPLQGNTIMGKKLRNKWNKLFKLEPHKEQFAIKVLEAELNWRKKNNTLEYIHNMETWLNQGDFEKYAYLLDQEIHQNYDFM